MSAADLVEYAELQRAIGRLEGEMGHVRQTLEELRQSHQDQDRKLSQLCASVKLADRAGSASGRKWGAFAGALAAGLLSAVAKATGIL